MNLQSQHWKKYFQDYVYLLLFSGSLVLIDQVSKAWIRATLSPGTIYRPDLWISQYARLMHWQNTGMAFGMFQNLGDVFTFLSFAVGLVILYYYPRVPREEWPLRVAMGMQLGGATGNLVDRLARGHVTDFISIGNFAVFNVADACISMGVAVLVVGMWIRERQVAAQEAAADAEIQANSAPAPLVKAASETEETLASSPSSESNASQEAEGNHEQNPAPEPGQ